MMTEFVVSLKLFLSEYIGFKNYEIFKTIRSKGYTKLCMKNQILQNR